MNNTALFLKNIHLLAQKLSWLENDAVVDELKALIITNSHLLNEDKVTNAFINELIYCSEKNVTAEDVAKLIAHLNAFFIAHFLSHPCHVIFIGRDWAAYQRTALFLPTNVEKTTVFEINQHTDPESVRVDLEDDTTIPIVVTDYTGFNFIKKNNIEFPEALTALQFPERNNDLYNEVIGFIPLLTERYEKALSQSDVKSVVVGSSYAWQGFPDELLEKSVNLSIFSGDITYSSSIIKNITETTSIKNFILCIGLYDVFYELSMRGVNTFSAARFFCSINNIEYSFRRKEGDIISEANKQYILGPLDLFILQIYAQETHQQYYGDEALSSINGLMQDETRLKKSVDFINQRTTCTNFTYSSTQILTRVSKLSKLYKRKNSFENNKQVLASLIALLKAKGCTLNIIVMPFTQFFIKNFESDLKNETLEFIESITDNTTVFMKDFSTHDAFGPEDFSDADHLNFNGANKLCSLAKQLGIAL
ncbi:hypothetical protein [Enterobacter sp. Bisph1]|uniref:hypothetical protein n=1 Tax=Enterobacter sp. Bisph1 TaxID=1274399 RepID=UPI00057BF776|nr:hypothetical protein [Enterobacter sp. Bisph1]